MEADADCGHDAAHENLLASLAVKELCFLALFGGAVLFAGCIHGRVLGGGQGGFGDEGDDAGEEEDAGEEPEVGAREADGVDGVVHEVVEGEGQHEARGQALQDAQTLEVRGGLQDDQEAAESGAEAANERECEGDPDLGAEGDEIVIFGGCHRGCVARIRGVRESEERGWVESWNCLFIKFCCKECQL